MNFEGLGFLHGATGVIRRGCLSVEAAESTRLENGA